MYCCAVGGYALFCNGVWECVCVLLLCLVGVVDVMLFVWFVMHVVLGVLRVLVFLFRRVGTVCSCPACILLQFLMLYFV